MTVTFRKAARGNIGLLLMVAGGTGSGKTWSAMALAKGMAGEQRFAVCDTERGRASIYADVFDFDVFELDAPFSPERYLEVVLAAEAKGYPVLVIDSMSHEWEGPGGLLAWHEELMGGQEAKNLSAWIKPKLAHRKFVNAALQAKPHVIMCFRAAERVEVTEVTENGRRKTKIIPKRSLTGLDGWMPITEKTLPFEATASFMLMADQPGMPHPIKLPDPLRPLVPLMQPLSEETGAALAKWAAGGSSSVQPSDAEVATMAAEVLRLAAQLGKREVTEDAIAKDQAKRGGDLVAHLAWLRRQRARFEQAVAAAEDALKDQQPAEAASA